MGYAVYDFTETIAGEGIEREFIEKVIAAWGRNDDYSEWCGGFLVKTKDGKFLYLTGWCDTTGWGCQDGTEMYLFDKEPKLSELEDEKYGSQYSDRPFNWDIEPADLNRFIETGEGRWE